jgi:hypothetical protein
MNCFPANRRRRWRVSRPSGISQGSDTIHMLKMPGAYRHLSKAADRGDEAANIISSIVMKHT